MVTWTVNLEGGPRRVNHAAVSVGNKIYSFGGYCSGELAEAGDPLDVHVLDTIQYRWRKLEPVFMHEDHVVPTSGLEILRQESEKIWSSVPYQRYGLSAVEYDGKAYLWGGRNDDHGTCNLLHEYDPDKNMYRRVEIDGYMPPSRDGHTAVVWNHQMFIFGGFEDEAQRFSHETYVFDFATSSWHEFPTTGDPPICRDFHSASIIDGIMYIFGGRSDHTGQFHTNNDHYDDTLMALNLTTGEWSRPEIRGGEIRPGGRRSHSTWVYDGKMYMFGGYLGTSNVHYNELYCFDPKTVSWSIIDVRGTYPAPRRRHCSVLYNGKVYIFGGTMPTPACHPLSTVHYNGNISPSSLSDVADLHVLDFSPSLKSLAMRKVVRDLNFPSTDMYSALQFDLPIDLRYEMYRQVTPINMPPSGVLRKEQSG